MIEKSWKEKCFTWKSEFYALNIIKFYKILLITGWGGYKINFMAFYLQHDTS